jgi:hypothetical protein
MFSRTSRGTRTQDWRPLGYGTHSTCYTTGFCGGGDFPVGKEVGVRNWPLFSIYRWECVEFYLQSTSIELSRLLRGVERGRCIRLTTSPQSVSLLSKQWAIINISHTYRPPRPVTRLVLLTFYSSWNIFTINLHSWQLCLPFPLNIFIIWTYRKQDTLVISLQKSSTGSKIFLTQYTSI